MNNKSNLGGPSNKIFSFNDRAKQKYDDDFDDDFSMEDLAFIDAEEKNVTNNKLEIISTPPDAAVTKNHIQFLEHSSNSAIRHENPQKKLRDITNSNKITNLQNSSTPKISKRGPNDVALTNRLKFPKKQCLEKKNIETSSK